MAGGAYCTAASAGACALQLGNPWPLVDGWLRVEYKNAAGNWIGVTRTWLQLGFARGTGHPGNCAGWKHRPSQRDSDFPAAGWRPECWMATSPRRMAPSENGNQRQFAVQLVSHQLFRSARGLSPRRQSRSSGLTVLRQRNHERGRTGRRQPEPVAAGQHPGLVDYSGQNGYLLFFSDRRGMMPDPNAWQHHHRANTASRMSSTRLRRPELRTESWRRRAPTGFSPEDVDENKCWTTGAQPMWETACASRGTVGNPYKTVDCLNGGRQNIVTGARHVLRLVDGSLNNVPVRPDNGLGGFTVAAENPVYVFGDYNSNAGDPFWGNPMARRRHQSRCRSGDCGCGDAASPTASGWSDLNSMKNALN